MDLSDQCLPATGKDSGVLAQPTSLTTKAPAGKGVSPRFLIRSAKSYLENDDFRTRQSNLHTLRSVFEAGGTPSSLGELGERVSGRKENGERGAPVPAQLSPSLPPAATPSRAGGKGGIGGLKRNHSMGSLRSGQGGNYNSNPKTTTNAMPNTNPNPKTNTNTIATLNTNPFPKTNTNLNTNPNSKTNTDATPNATPNTTPNPNPNTKLNINSRHNTTDPTTDCRPWRLAYQSRSKSLDMREGSGLEAAPGSRVGGGVGLGGVRGLSQPLWPWERGDSSYVRSAGKAELRSCGKEGLVVGPEERRDGRSRILLVVEHSGNSPSLPGRIKPSSDSEPTCPKNGLFPWQPQPPSFPLSHTGPTSGSAPPQSLMGGELGGVRSLARGGGHLNSKDNEKENRHGTPRPRQPPPVSNKPTPSMGTGSPAWTVPSLLPQPQPEPLVPERGPTRTFSKAGDRREEVLSWQTQRGPQEVFTTEIVSRSNALESKQEGVGEVTPKTQAFSFSSSSSSFTSRPEGGKGGGSPVHLGSLSGSVRNRIHRFETLAQQSQGPRPGQPTDRRPLGQTSFSTFPFSHSWGGHAVSEPEPSRSSPAVQKSGSDSALGDRRERERERQGTGREQGSRGRPEWRRGEDERRRAGWLRSVSMDNGSRGRREEPMSRRGKGVGGETVAPLPTEPQAAPRGYVLPRAQEEDQFDVLKLSHLQPPQEAPAALPEPSTAQASATSNSNNYNNNNNNNNALPSNSFPDSHAGARWAPVVCGPGSPLSLPHMAIIEPPVSQPDRSTWARWSSEEEDSDDSDDSDTDVYEDSENCDYDSDSSSVTITSNMSQSDRRSFSMSLAELCDFGGLELLHPGDPGGMNSDSEDSLSERSASLRSNMSALSLVSIIPSDELERLLDDVRGLEEETLESYEDVHVVVLHKEAGAGLGFTVAGGVDQNKPVVVHKVFPCGLAAQEGSICEGDRVLSINGTQLQNSAHWEALRTLRRARSRAQAIVVLQKGGSGQRPHHSDLLPDPGEAGRTLRVLLNKSSSDLGFSLEGGRGSSQGDRALTVKKVFLGGPVEQVFPGDEILEVKGHSLRGLRRLEAWNWIKRLPSGPVEVLLHRKHRL